MGKRKKENDTFLKKKAEERQNSATIMISIDAKGTVFPMMLKLQGNCFRKHTWFFQETRLSRQAQCFLKFLQFEPEMFLKCFL